MASIELVSVHEFYSAKDVLYELLLERSDKPEVNISHKSCPTYEEHSAFVEHHPYEAWYLIVDGTEAVGSVYLTKPPKPSIAGNEIGIFILQRHHRKGYASQAIKLLMEKHPRDRYLANINPDNVTSISLFEKLGFKLCQYTFERML